MIKYILKQGISFIMDTLETIAFVGSIYMIIHFFIVSPHRIQGSSMVPTFHENEYIFTSKITYKLRPMKRGDVIIVRRPDSPDKKLLIKRLIGLPNDEVMIKDGDVYVNGIKLNEPYTNTKTHLPRDGGIEEGKPYKVPPGYVFVLGDNRDFSEDSRRFGPIPVENIEGVVFFRYLPLHKFGPIQNPFPKNLQTFFQEYKLA